MIFNQNVNFAMTFFRLLIYGCWASLYFIVTPVRAERPNFKNLLGFLSTNQASKAFYALVDSSSFSEQAIVSLLKSPNKKERYWACAILGNKKKVRYIPELRKLLSDMDWEVRLSSLLALSEMKVQIDLQILTMLGKDQIASIRKLVEALKMRSDTEREDYISNNALLAESIVKLEGDDNRLRSALLTCEHKIFRFNDGRSLVFTDVITWGGRYGRVKVVWFSANAFHKQYLSNPKSYHPMEPIDNYFQRPSVVLEKIGGLLTLVVLYSYPSGSWVIQGPIFYRLDKSKWRAMNEIDELRFSEHGSFYFSNRKILQWDICEVDQGHWAPHKFILSEYIWEKFGLKKIRERTTKQTYSPIPEWHVHSIIKKEDPLREFDLSWKWWSPMI